MAHSVGKRSIVSSACRSRLAAPRSYAVSKTLSKSVRCREEEDDDLCNFGVTSHPRRRRRRASGISEPIRRRLPRLSPGVRLLLFVAALSSPSTSSASFLLTAPTTPQSSFGLRHYPGTSRRGQTSQVSVTQITSPAASLLPAAAPFIFRGQTHLRSPFPLSSTSSSEMTDSSSDEPQQRLVLIGAFQSSHHVLSNCLDARLE
jgi:hypothetical protein